MNTSAKHIPMSESASSISALASGIALAVRRTESTVLRNIIVAAALFVVIVLVAFGQSTRSGADAVANDPAPNLSALQSAPHGAYQNASHNAAHNAYPGAAHNAYPGAAHNASPGAAHSASSAGVLPAWLAGSDVFTTRNGYAEFTADMVGCLGVFAGDSRRLGGSVDLRTGAFDFYLYLKTLSTGIPDRDSGMQAALNLEKHPFAEFTGTFHPAFAPYSGAPQHVTATGAFTLNGVTHQVEIPATLQIGQNGILLEAEWILDITEFGIQPPSSLSVTVSSEQEIRLEATLEPQLFASPHASQASRLSQASQSS